VPCADEPMSVTERAYRIPESTTRVLLAEFGPSFCRMNLSTVVFESLAQRVSKYDYEPISKICMSYEPRWITLLVRSGAT
jgi:hypothetical protein